MARAVPLTEPGLLTYMGRLPQAKASFKQLVRELGAKGPSRERLAEVLERLAHKGLIVEYRPEHYIVIEKSREYFTGRLRVHRDGYGFLITEKPIEGIEGDIFLNPRSASRAMDGDRIVVQLERIDLLGRADGRIVKVLERKHQTVVGEFHHGRFENYVKPHSDRIRQVLIIPAGMEKPPQESVDRIGAAAAKVASPSGLDGMIVNVEVLDFPQGDEPGKARVVEILGRPDDFGVDVEIMIRKHHIPHRFPTEVLQQAEAFNQTLVESEVAGRQDFREMEIVTIDGETARDFDDAVWVERTGAGNFLLHVHIADVSHYVLPGSPIDKEASRRGTSVYFPDRAVPMLPLELSTELCSLKPHVDRLVQSALLEITPQGEVVEEKFTRGVIRSAQRMTYTVVHKLLDGDAGLREEYKTLVPRFELMRDLALILNKKRMKRGSIDFDLPEPLIEFDEHGMMVGVTRTPRNIAHRIIEEFMLAANEAVARHIRDIGLPSIYRIHDPPDAQRVLEFEEIAAQFGYSLGIRPAVTQTFRNTQRRRDGRKSRKDIQVSKPTVEVRSRDYQKLVAKVEGKPEERIVTFLMLRSMRQARYSEENTGHFALASDCYTHFTSPIRRYPDLIVHRVLGDLLDRAPAATPQTPWGKGSKKEKNTAAAREGLEHDPDLKQFAAIAQDCSFTERRAEEAGRELVEWKKLKFMADKVGDEFAALVINVNKYGLTIELTDLFIEGQAPMESLSDDRYFYQENARKIVGGKNGREFKIGDRLPVRLDRVDAVERRLHFSVVVAEAVKAGGKSKRRKKEVETK